MKNRTLNSRKRRYLLFGGTLVVSVGVLFFQSARPIYAEGRHFQIDTGGTLTTGLRSYLKMEDETDFWGALSSYIVGSSAFDSGKVNNALVGDGYLGVSPGSALGFENTDTFSLAAWVQNSGANGESIVDKFVSGRGWKLHFENNRYVLVISSRHDDQDHYIQVQTRDAFSDGLWHLVVFTYDGSSAASGVRIYVDNVNQPLDVISDTLDGSIATAMDGHIKIGIDKVDEMGIWDKMLSSQEINNLWNGGNGQTMVERPDIIPVSIDIRPDNKENVINLGSGGTVSVAIFGSDDLDVRQIDPASVIFAGAPIEFKSNEKSDYEDINKDGFADAVVNISIQKLQLTLSDTSAELEGFLMDGTGIKGSDMVRVVPR